MANVKSVICPYTGIMMRATMCDMRFCPRCGWNPAVHAARVDMAKVKCDRLPKREENANEGT